MPYLEPYESKLTSSQAAHLLRRATFGPTPSEIVAFTGLSPREAVDKLVRNVELTISSQPPVVLYEDFPTAGQTFLDKPFDYENRFAYSYCVKFWWVGLMAAQNGNPSLLEKLTAFWQNHFVTTHKVVEDYRFMYRYLTLLRKKCLGNFKELVLEITKDPSMLVYQNGNENEKDHPNENYAREVQELFTIGQRNQQGEPNYLEQDVKEAARVLTGWQVVNRYIDKSTTFASIFVPEKHDDTNKNFSAYYGNTVIRGRSGLHAGDEEVTELIDMFLAHPESSKFICRKLYRWYVNTNVTAEIELNVIIPLANFFASSENNFAIEPVLRRLLISQEFFDNRNRGAIVKSPAEFVLGTFRHFNKKVPDAVSEFGAFRNYTDPTYWRMSELQLDFLDQPLVFGSLPYYQTGYSLNWINSSTIGMRRRFTDSLLNTYDYYPGYQFGIDFLKWMSDTQPNFSDVKGTPALTCEQVFEEMSRHLFALDLTQAQIDFLIDMVMMRTSPRNTWIYEWNAFRSDPNSGALWVVKTRLQALMKYMLSMAEFQVF